MESVANHSDWLTTHKPNCSDRSRVKVGTVIPPQNVSETENPAFKPILVPGSDEAVGTTISPERGEGGFHNRLRQQLQREGISEVNRKTTRGVRLRGQIEMTPFQLGTGAPVQIHSKKSLLDHRISQERATRCHALLLSDAALYGSRQIVPSKEERWTQMKWNN
ncbi:unnamed protein product [Pleuronectes platessa]|uniref:Uncharacterized protein n=1 Tax=Pleuronectes platessa TaxID=8262 RepID=A0A9N7VUU6_PLEPL|nr:unnamed protein product [Pleuronectes platessa]